MFFSRIIAFFMCFLMFSGPAFAGAAERNPRGVPVITVPLPTKYPKILPGDTVVYAGDSITRLGGSTEQGGPGWQLLFSQIVDNNVANVTHINSGVPGNRTTDLMARFNTTVLNFHPQVLFLFIGVNDIDTFVPVANIVENVSVMVNTAQRAGVREVVLVSCYGRFERADGLNPFDTQVDTYNYFLYALSAKSGVYYLPLRAYKAYAEALVNPAGITGVFMLPDGLHESLRGDHLINGAFCATFGYKTKVDGL